MARLDELARFSSETGRLTRLYLTPEHKAAALCIEGWMREAGMQAHVDAVGNVVGRYAGKTPDARTLILGSHIDTVRDAGKYDGALGVISAIQAVGELNTAGERLDVAIEVVAFGDEEGVRFPVTLNGSRALASSFDPASLDVRDNDGISLADALRAFGGDPATIASLRRDPSRISGYVELHIEQGPVLESEDLPVGVVTAISGASRFSIVVSGVAGHAGTVPMNLRRDAVAAAAEVTLAVEAVASSADDLVATVGYVAVKPGAVNVIASETTLSLDIRSPRDAVRLAAIEELQSRIAAISVRRKVEIRMSCTYDAPAVTCDAKLIERLSRAVERHDIRPRLLPSGAGHDGLVMAALAPVGMLFVRCRGGISHNPAESITPADAGTGISVLVEFLRGYASGSAASS